MRRRRSFAINCVLAISSATDDEPAATNDDIVDVPEEAAGDGPAIPNNEITIDFPAGAASDDKLASTMAYAELSSRATA